MPAKRKKKTTKRSTLYKWWLRYRHWVGIGFGAIAVLAGVGLGVVYHVYAKDLPTDAQLTDWRPNESTRIYDRNGKLLYEIYGDTKRTVVPSDQISASVKNATVAIEDARFYSHPGVDMRAVARAFVTDVKAGGNVQGASTLTQQLAKNVFLNDDRTFSRKIKEALLAIRLERHFTKDQILTMYLNQVGYGGNAYGVEAAANTYFGKSAKDLDIAQAATLGSLVESPSHYSPYGDHVGDLVARRNDGIDRMASLGYITEDQAKAAKAEKLEVVPYHEQITAPHFVLYVKQLLIEKYGEDKVSEGGLQVTTTLDAGIQAQAESVVANSIPQITQTGADNVGMVVIDPKTGGILAMVGSRDYFDKAHNGNVNVTLSLRQPGSSFKPIVYADAFNKGPWSPGSTLFDVQTNFGNQQTPYIPANYDGKFRGPVSIREALANSYNIPAVKMMGLLGKDETIRAAQSVGITTFTDPSQLGLSLVLGGGDVKLLELTGAYGVFAQNGTWHAPQAIQKVSQYGTTLYQSDTAGKEIFKPEAAYEINSILSDNDARKPIFGPHSALVIDGKDVAAKTGTTNDYRDAWTIGYTPSVVAGVWVGNNDNHPMKQGSAGAMAAAPIWHDFMSRYLVNKPNEPFAKPSDISDTEFDTATGQSPTIGTQATRHDIVAPWQKPGQIQLASYNEYACDGTQKDQKLFYIVHSEMPNNPEWERPVQGWAQSHGYATGSHGDNHDTCPSPSPAPDESASPLPVPEVPPSPTPAPLPPPAVSPSPVATPIAPPHPKP